MKRKVCFILRNHWVGYATGYMAYDLACGRSVGRFATRVARKVTCSKCLANMPPVVLVALHQELRNK